MDPSHERPSGIFISYRRDVASAYAGRVYDHLSNRFGEGRVFMDVDSIELGMDFTESLERAVEACIVMLVLMGPDWADARSARGARRLEDPNDYVRIEVETALKRGVRVVPLLIGGAALPASEDLPDEIRPLTRRQALELKDATFRSDIAVLSTRLERVIERPAGVAVEAVSQAPARPTEAPARPAEAPARPAEAPAQPKEVPGGRRGAAVLDAFEFLRGKKGIFLWPDLPSDRVRIARNAAGVPPDEEILVLVNLALVGKKIALMFGIRGMYLRNNILVKTDTTMSYEELAKAKQIRAMDKYNLAIDSRQFACSGLTADVKLDDLVRAVVQLRARLQ